LVTPGNLEDDGTGRASRRHLMTDQSTAKSALQMRGIR
jgi:hypothetical protein